jgi:hypothetical protein
MRSGLSCESVTGGLEDRETVRQSDKEVDKPIERHKQKDRDQHSDREKRGRDNTRV